MGFRIPRLHSDILIRIKEPENFHRKYTGSIETISYRKLSRENRLTYDVLDYYLELSKKESDYLLYEEPMGTVSGVQTQIPVLLSEYQFQSKEDVDAYLELMKTTPDYFNSLIAFEQEKAQKGLFMASYTADTVIEQCQAFIDMGDSNYLISTFVDRIQKLTDLPNRRKVIISRKMHICCRPMCCRPIRAD